LLSGATALVFPSLYEGFGFPVLEAQACGTAVICANTSSLPEIAGEGALLVDPLDQDAISGALQQVADDKALRERLVVSGYENVRRFSWQKAAAGVLEALERSAAAPVV
jgi:glycosyltransferase involved in cell wall biosynthesis